MRLSNSTQSNYILVNIFSFLAGVTKSPVKLIRQIDFSQTINEVPMLHYPGTDSVSKSQQSILTPLRFSADLCDQKPCLQMAATSTESSMEAFNQRESIILCVLCENQEIISRSHSQSIPKQGEYYSDCSSRPQHTLKSYKIRMAKKYLKTHLQSLAIAECKLEQL